MKQNHRAKEWRLTGQRSTTGGEKRKVAEKAMKTSFHLQKPIQSHQVKNTGGKGRVLGREPTFPSATFDHCSDAQLPFVIEMGGFIPINAESRISISACDQSSDQQLQRKHECSFYWTTSIDVTSCFSCFS